MALSLMCFRAALVFVLVMLATVGCPVHAAPPEDAASPAPAVTPVPVPSAAPSTPAAQPAPAKQQVEMRVYNARARDWKSFDDLLEAAASNDVVFIGEAHDDDATHATELALLQALLARRKDVVLGLEMFERDVQAALEDYLAGRIDEAAFLARSRPWPNYAGDYRPLVEAAKTARARVLATNVPRPIASSVARRGLSALDDIPANHRWMYARHTSSPRDAYWDRFREIMKGHVDEEALMRYYQAQCLKDDTMAETIADWFERAAPVRPLVLHVNGSFHSDQRLGVVARTRERMRGTSVLTVRIVAVPDPADVDTSKWASTADWIVFVKSTGD